MGKYASKVVMQAKSWLGKNEADGSFKVIIDTYNSHKPLARGYKMPYDVAWCATFVSAVAIKLGYTDIIPTECGCERMIELFKKIGSWVENENRTPKPGDIIFYDWQDKGAGDNKGWSDHVGIVEKVSNGKITIIEGNYSNSVKRRTIAVNARYIRGYGVPKYDAEKTTVPKKETVTVKVKVSGTVLAWQKAAIADGYKFPKYGADGQWGAECEAVAKQAICKKPKIKGFYTNRNLTKFLQKQLGFTGADVDGKFWNDTYNALRVRQGKLKIEVDGVAGYDTWKAILGV
jgi:hypothetical protein